RPSMHAWIDAVAESTGLLATKITKDTKKTTTKRRARRTRGDFARRARAAGLRNEKRHGKQTEMFVRVCVSVTLSVSRAGRLRRPPSRSPTRCLLRDLRALRVFRGLLACESSNPSRSLYSDCSARVGSTAAALLAGTALATSATPISAATTAAIVSGS